MKFPEELNEQIKNAPVTPGCYIYRDSKDKVLYIGKAVNIRNRVNSYFANFNRLDPKIKSMVRKINDVEFVTTESELEALILETNLIKKYRPKYNRLMKDDKNYVWLMVTRQEDFPRIELVREKKSKQADYFGPYSNPKPIRNALKSLRNIFPYRTCNRDIRIEKSENGKRKFHSSNRKPCLYYHLGLCNAPCNDLVSKKDYRDNINKIKHFFRSRKFVIVEELNAKMTELSSNLKFEEASKIRDKLEDLKYLTQRIRIEHRMDEELWRKKKKDLKKKALKRLLEKISFSEYAKYFNKPFEESELSKFKIECYDISNISGKQATGSMVVFVGGKADKKLYRKFKVKTKTEPDDFLMLKEVLQRRFKQTNSKSTDKSFSEFPDLIIVDGGKGQLSSVFKIIKSMKLKVPVIGLAKREEEIIKIDFEKEEIEFKTHKLPRGSEELFLIQRIRDEAHRFAIKYHRKLRSKKQIVSVLDTIPGVGKVIKKRLLKAFGSTANIKKASREELQAIVKNKKTVNNIMKLL